MEVELTMAEDKKIEENEWEYQRAPIGFEQWEDYTQETNVPHFAAYLEATGGIVQELEELLKKKTSFDELKNELTRFVADRKTFVIYGLNHFPA